MAGGESVEVTNAADEDAERLRGESERRYTAPELAATWAVWLPKNPGALKLKPLLRELAPLLAVQERHGVDHVGRDVQAPQEPEAAEAARQIARLRVRRAMRLADAEPGEDACLVLAFSGSASSSFDALNALVAETPRSRAATK